MVLTWTRFVPDHYDIAATSLSSLADRTGKQPFPFMRLPVELRIQVYKEYLVDRYSLSAAEVHEMVLDRRHRSKRPAEILQVSKAVNAEVEDILRHETTFNLRICWQDATFDGLVRSCLQAQGKRLDYNNVAHLRIEVYPPHQDRPIDIVYIWRHVRKLCLDLQKASCVRHLSIHFLENEYAAWSFKGVPVDRIYGLDYTEAFSSDIRHIFDLLQTLNNVTKAQIHVPASLNKDVNMHELRKDTEDVMMKRMSPNGKYHVWLPLVHENLTDCEKPLKHVTGRRSQEKLDRSCGLGYWISESHLDIFEKVWPHRDYVLEYVLDYVPDYPPQWVYQPRSQYKGDDDLENAPLSHTNHYRSEDYNRQLFLMDLRERAGTL